MQAKALLRSTTRIAGTAAAVSTALFVAFWLYATQPFAGRAPSRLRASADPMRLRRHVELLAALAPVRDAAHPEVLDQAADYIARELAQAGAEVKSQAYSVRGSRFRNVVGVLGGGQERFVVVGAHYDAFGDAGPNPGADDNASGTAGLLELARLLARESLPVEVHLVAFSTEEPPYYASPFMGSAVHARSVAARKPEAMICLEMIGYFTETQDWPSPLMRLMYPGNGQFIGVVGRPADRPLVARLKSSLAARGEIAVTSYAGPFFDGLDASDHRNYWEIGVPAAMIGDTAFLRNPNYHAPSDVPQSLDYTRMSQVVNGVANALLSWSRPTG
jgi:Zn-dependent M28 family amino/carboxypeptidase